MSNTGEYVPTYNKITNRLEAIKTAHEALLQEVEELKADERKIMAYIGRESQNGGLFPSEIAEWQVLKTKYADKV